MKCWICKRQARGFGHADVRFNAGDPRRQVTDWVFCSRRCQDAFHLMYGNWRRVQDGRLDATEVAMIAPSDVERGAMRACLKAFGAVAGEIGFGKSLGDYSEAEALRVIEAIVTSYSAAMVAHHEATKYPPVRGATPAPDPLGLSELEDTGYWEAKR